MEIDKEKLIKFAQQCIKHHFWILAGLISLLFLGTWFFSTKSIKDDTNDLTSAISSDFDTGNRIISEVNHPNEMSAQGMDSLNEAEATEVMQAWQIRYSAQENILEWPDELEDDFIEQVEDWQPIELHVPHPTPSNIELDLILRDRYNNYIKNELPKLAEEIGAIWHPLQATGTADGGEGDGGLGGFGGLGGPGGGLGGPGGDLGGGVAQPEEPDFIVDWNAANQEQLQNMRFDWSTAPDQLPSTLQILYAQEDLWVLKALMQIVARTNGGADAQYNAAIKSIEAIDLGANAAGIKSVGQVQTAAGGGTSNDFYDQGPGPGDLQGPGTGSNSGVLGQPGSGYEEEVVIPDPAENRYVDATGEPLPASRLRSALGSTTGIEDAFLAVAKRMPVRIRVNMDLRKLPDFLAECGNSELPIEVRQVRINTPAGTGGGAGGGFGGLGPGMGGPGMGGPGMGGPGMGGGLGGPGMGGPGMGGPGMGGGGGLGDPGGGEGSGDDDPYGGLGGFGGPAAAEFDENPYDGEVEIYGIVYIYNPVDPAKLGLELVGPGDGAAVDAAAAGEGTDVDGATGDGVAADDGTPADDGAPGGNGAPADGGNDAADGNAAAPAS